MGGGEAGREEGRGGGESARRDEGQKLIVPSNMANLYSCEQEFYAEALILRNAI